MSVEREQVPRRDARSFVASFKYAIDGVAYAFRTQRNMRVHAIFAVMAVVLGCLLHIDACEWAAVAICASMVFAAECMNTALEALVDGVSPGYSEFARRAKDCAAGCVLLCAFGSVVVACIVYGGAFMKMFC